MGSRVEASESSGKVEGGSRVWTVDHHLAALVLLGSAWLLAWLLAGRREARARKEDGLIDAEGDDDECNARWRTKQMGAMVDWMLADGLVMAR